jgi:hypothetical protein
MWLFIGIAMALPIVAQNLMDQINREKSEATSLSLYYSTHEGFQDIKADLER